jgi:hypothetical protein
VRVGVVVQWCDVTEQSNDDPAAVARAVEAIEGASIVFWAIFVLGPAWSIVVPFMGWGFFTWIIGAAVWCCLLFLAVQNLTSLPCPQCGRPWRGPITEVAPPRLWLIQRQCNGCGFRLRDYWTARYTIGPRGPKTK